MEKKLYISGRQSGKTEAVLSVFAKNPDNTIIIGCNHNMVRTMHSRVRERSFIKNIDSISRWREIRGFNVSAIKTILVDEAMFMDGNQLAEVISRFLNAERMVAWSTSDNLYLRDLIVELQSYDKKMVWDKYLKMGLVDQRHEYHLNSMLTWHDLDISVSDVNLTTLLCEVKSLENMSKAISKKEYLLSYVNRPILNIAEWVLYRDLL